MGGQARSADPTGLTTVANIADGWVEGGVYIGRRGRGLDGYFGNPYVLSRMEVSREQAIARYERYFARRMATDPEFKSRVEALKGKTLLCFCKPLACHGDVIAEHLNAQS